MSDRDKLLQMLATRSFRLGHFQLSSGGFSDYYVDCRTTTLHPEGALLTGRLLLEALRRVQPAPEGIGGLTLGADPIVVSVAVQSAGTVHPIRAFIVRKAEKSHGMGRRIEGEVWPGMRVAIVDDVCTTAASTILALEAAWASQLDVVGVWCLIEREEAGGRERLDEVWNRQFKRDCPFIALYTSTEVRNEHERLLRSGAIPTVTMAGSKQ